MKLLICALLNLACKVGSAIYMITSIVYWHQGRVAEATLTVGWAVLLYLIAKED